MRRRTSLTGDLSSRKRRMVRRSSSCSSEKAKFKTGPPSTWFSRQAQHALTDDVLLDLARAGVDRLRPAEHEDALELVEHVLAVDAAGGDLRRRAQHVHRQLTERAMPRAPEQLAAAGLGSEHALFHQLGDHPQTVVLHHLHAHVGVGETLADRVVFGRAPLPVSYTHL